MLTSPSLQEFNILVANGQSAHPSLAKAQRDQEETLYQVGVQMMFRVMRANDGRVRPAKPVALFATADKPKDTAPIAAAAPEAPAEGGDDENPF